MYFVHKSSYFRYRRSGNETFCQVRRGNSFNIVFATDLGRKSRSSDNITKSLHDGSLSCVLMHKLISMSDIKIAAAVCAVEEIISAYVDTSRVCKDFKKHNNLQRAGMWGKE